MKARYRVHISGGVQDVGFRAFLERVASRFNLKGWTRNLKNGRVEAVFEGEKEDLEDALKILERGPPFSEVEKMDVDEEAYTGEFDVFDVR
ncbi:MAG: acylphosphatase [Candidatus Hydrothermarchaeales archaeon]